MDEPCRRAAFEKLENVPRLQFGFYPTPLCEMPRLRAKLGKNCPRLFIKHDDFTGFGSGGNKIRKLEYIFENLLRDGVEAVVTTGGERSNHARMTAFFCARLGMKCALVLDRKPRPAGTEGLKPASIFLAELLGTEVYMAESIEERRAKAVEVVAKMRAEGVNVFEIPLGGALPHGVFGFATAMKEMLDQAAAMGIEFSHLYFSSSTAGTHSGMLLGAELNGAEGLCINGISPEPDSKDEIVAEIRRLGREAGEILGIIGYEPSREINVFDEFAGDGYCIETAEANNAINLLAETEGVVLDPVYTAKAMAGLIDHIEKGILNEEDNVLFWHTGGQITQFYLPA